MKIALMSGAYVNAGDFLIEERSKALLEAFIDQAEVTVLKRNISYDDRIDELNRYDLIVFGGGPGYQSDIYPSRIPFVSDWTQLVPPISLMGQGWKGRQILKGEGYSSKMSDATKSFFRYAEKRGKYLGCRDWHTIYFLKNIGFHSFMMTGCPAWYDLKNINNLHVVNSDTKSYSNICVSDAAYKSNIPFMKPLIIYLRRKFPESKISLLFHRGINKENEHLTDSSFLEQYHLEYKDISGSANGFSIYDTCDLHIGFRVHAHIYNLSRGNISILLNEDMRGNGVNDALGLYNIDIPFPKTFIPKKASSERIKLLLTMIDNYFYCINDTNRLQYISACSRIQYYYTRMQKFIKDLENI